MFDSQQEIQTVQLDNCDPKSVEEVLNFLYSGRLNLDAIDSGKVFSVAKACGIKGLLDLLSVESAPSELVANGDDVVVTAGFANAGEWPPPSKQQASVIHRVPKAIADDEAATKATVKSRRAPPLPKGTPSFRQACSLHSIFGCSSCTANSTTSSDDDRLSRPRFESTPRTGAAVESLKRKLATPPTPSPSSIFGASTAAASPTFSNPLSSFLSSAGGFDNGFFNIYAAAAAAAAASASNGNQQVAADFLRGFVTAQHRQAATVGSPQAAPPPLPPKRRRNQGVLTDVESSASASPHRVTAPAKQAKLAATRVVTSKSTNLLDATDAVQLSTEVDGELQLPTESSSGWCRNRKYILKTPDGYQCELCKKTYHRYNSTSYHVTIYHRNPPIRCDHEGCSFTTREARYIHFHKYYRHNTPLPQNIEVDSRSCPFCKHIAKSPAMLEKHISRHMPECVRVGKNYHCQQCEQPLASRAQLVQHMLAHKDIAATVGTQPQVTPVVDSLQCDACAYKCKSAATLQQHKLFKHSASMWQKKHKCADCSFTSPSATDLIAHRSRMHTAGDDDEEAVRTWSSSSEFDGASDDLAAIDDCSEAFAGGDDEHRVASACKLRPSANHLSLGDHETPPAPPPSSLAGVPAFDASPTSTDLLLENALNSSNASTILVDYGTV